MKIGILGTGDVGKVLAAGFMAAGHEVMIGTRDPAAGKLKDRVWELTRRTRGTKIGVIVAELREFLLGWKAYFGIAEVLSPLRDIDKWVRRKLRCYLWKQWGSSGLPEIVQPRGVCARSVEHQQVGPRSVAVVEDTGTGDCATIALLQEHGTTEPCATVGIQFIEPPDT